MSRRMSVLNARSNARMAFSLGHNPGTMTIFYAMHPVRQDSKDCTNKPKQQTTPLFFFLAPPEAILYCDNIVYSTEPPFQYLYNNG